MILSVSQRCDIPAFFADWFYRRLEAGYVDVRSPYNPKVVSRIELKPENLDCIFFLSKNPTSMLSQIHLLDKYLCCFQISITPYHSKIEPGIHDKREVIESFKALSRLLGKSHIQLRYDPIYLSEEYTIDYHERAFKKLLAELHDYCDTVIFSYLDIYKNTKAHGEQLRLSSMQQEQMYEIASRLAKIAHEYNVNLQTCGEDINLEAYGIIKGSCISTALLERLSGKKISIPLRKSRKCGCIESVDIGAYNCCKHYCAYCYANFDESRIEQMFQEHDPTSSLISGRIHADDTIVVKQQKKVRQLELL